MIGEGSDVRLQPGEHLVCVSTPQESGVLHIVLFGDAWSRQRHDDLASSSRLTLKIARAQLASALDDLDELIARTEPTRLSHTEGARS